MQLVINRHTLLVTNELGHAVQITRGAHGQYVWRDGAAAWIETSTLEAMREALRDAYHCKVEFGAVVTGASL